jgi:putative ABC transport system permease protein
MIFSENFRLALGALRANKMRSMLTTLGIIIGVAAVIAVVSVVQGLQFMVNDVFGGLGATYMFVVPDAGRREPGIAARTVRLTWDDGKAVRDQVAGIQLITPFLLGNDQVKYRDRQHRPSGILGVNEDYQEVNNHTVEIGRFFSSLDLANRRKVVVLGTEVVEKLKLGDEPIGKEIYVGKYPATVIGVMEKKGQALGENFDNFVLVPFESAIALFGRNAGEQIQLRLRVESTEAIEAVRDGITRILRQRHHIAEGDPDDFRVFVQDELLKQITGVISGVTATIAGVVSIALLVGGIGIMNIMLVSVTERTREIGVRKAVGARRQDILAQFLIEAVTLALVGGTLGLLVGWGMGALIVALVPANLPPAHVPLWAVALAFGFSAVVGIFFGIYPAGKAARLDPIEALRYE